MGLVNELSRRINNIMNYCKRPNEKQVGEKYVRVVFGYYATRFFEEDTNVYYDTYELPQGMSYKDFFKILSYYEDKAQKLYGFKKREKLRAVALNNIIGKLNFRKVADADETKIYPIFVNDDYCFFVDTYDWYQPRVDMDDLYRIGKKSGMYIPNDLEVILDKSLLKNKSGITK